MYRDEIIKLLEILSNAYPNTKIRNAGSMASAWEMTLGEFSSEAVYKASRYHMETSKFFPTPSEIRDAIVRAELVYSETATDGNLIEATSSDSDLVFIDGEYYRRDEWEEYCEAEAEAVAKFVGFGYEEDDDVPFPKKPESVKSGILPYEL